jgi:predicted acylesterase/phospholipase RssA
VQIQDVRIAVVLTGGVSLAVWMGGVCCELSRLVRGADLWQELTDAAGIRPSIDVISGSSAGGINGALLGVGLIHGADPGAMRDLWIEQADLGDLLRPTGETRPLSVLRGDDYFLPRIRSALAAMAASGPACPPTELPLDLIMTGTLLDGRREVLCDDFGTTFTDVRHRAEFRFRRGEGFGRDDFCDARGLAALAMAGRATSSFPGAFEPSWCAIGDGSESDVAGYADFDTSSFVLDGGVLVNKPLAPVVGLLAERPDGAARRVVTFIQPAPEDPSRTPGPEGPPDFGHVVRAGFLTIPHAESVAAQLELLHGQAAARAARGEGRLELLYLNAETGNAFDLRRSPQDKLAGLQLTHFGAFYKRSWRANDWMWGRLDAAARLVQLVLEPARIREFVMGDPAAPERMAAALATATGATDADVGAMQAELTALADPQRPTGEILACQRAATQALQLAVLREELPVIRRTIDADAEAGHRVSAAAREFSAAYDAADLSFEGRWPALFGLCRTGQERLADDAGSPAYTRLLGQLRHLALRLGGPHLAGVPSAGDAAPRPLRSWRLVLAETRIAWPLAWGLGGLGAMLVVAGLSAAAAHAMTVAAGALLLLAAVVSVGLDRPRLARMITVVISATAAGAAVLAAAGSGIGWHVWVVACPVACLAVLRARRPAH